MQRCLRKLKLKLAPKTQKSFSFLSVTFQLRVANFNFNFLSHYCIDFQNLCAHHEEEILRIPKHQLSDEYWPRKRQKRKGHPKLNKTPIFGKLSFSLNCHNLAHNNPNFTSWGCFRILRTSS